MFAHEAPANPPGRPQVMTSTRRPGGEAFGIERLLDSLASLPTPRRYWIGFSGGADSTALLQAMHEAGSRLSVEFHALHFHHGLQSQADAWEAHCRAFCRQRDIPFRSQRLDIDRSAGASPEEAARICRYRAIARILDQDEMYLTAHHSEDLAETLFLNLMRGSGVEGLAGIPALRRLDRGWVARPLLDVRRAELAAYLENRGIGWLTDPSNSDTRFDRNYLRQVLFPQLERRWPGLVSRLSRTARNARVSANAVAMYIERESGDLVRDALKMPLGPLLELTPEMQALVLRQWLRRNEVPALPELRLQEFLDQLATAGSESQAEVRWDDWMVKHHGTALWLQRNRPPPCCPVIGWKKNMELSLGAVVGELRLYGAPTQVPAGWRVRPRQPGDRIRLHAEGPSHKLKHLLQSAGIPPWLRSAIPLLEWDGEPVALGDWALAPDLRVWLRKSGLEYRWLPADPALERIHQDCQSTVTTP